MSEITPEGRVPAEMIPPLDPSLLKLSDVETEFLHATITQDDEELQRRILGVQKEAYDMYPYPCIRAFHYVSLMMCGNSIYPMVLAAGKSGNTRFLDLGCCMGSDVRKLAYDSYPVANILGCDLRQEYIDTSHKLYQDVLTSPIHFFTSNIFDVPVFFTATSNAVPVAGHQSLPAARYGNAHLYRSVVPSVLRGDAERDRPRSGCTPEEGTRGHHLRETLRVGEGGYDRRSLGPDALRPLPVILA
ncbi:hypothetical protein SCP_0604480 [Sparassis crispa]|uniref:Methyltransferase domain-containing protein n=1 Tax=Sparassis crispa TaxID=139825 RepID=A0A401GQN2_9APHY|nr:hypothetical protein SCP_0604480 [Sparassis crispa]GBE84469.1 hypothetical protein SCP_0604480 [Sparassis crispa]